MDPEQLFPERYTISPGHQLRLRANLNAGASSLESFQNRVTQTASGQPLNTAETTYLVDGSEWLGDAQLTWRKRLGDSGRSIVAEYRSGLQDSDRVTDPGSKRSPRPTPTRGGRPTPA